MSLLMLVIVSAIMHINGKFSFMQPSNVTTSKLLKNDENRSVETTENVLIYGGTFALKNFYQLQNYDTLSVIRLRMSWCSPTPVLRHYHGYCTQIISGNYANGRTQKNIFKIGYIFGIKCPNLWRAVSASLFSARIKQ